MTFVAVLSGALTAILIVVLQRLKFVGTFLDRIDKPHAMHGTPVPRIGGMAIITATIVVSLLAIDVFARESVVLSIMALAIVLACLSALDDRDGLSVRLRFGVHAVTAVVLMAVFYANFQTETNAQNLPLQFMANVAGLCFLVIVVLWMTNLYNFMDGANGLAGFMGTIGFAALAVAGHFAPPDVASLNLTTFSAAIAGACAVFLVFNFPHARVFLGDAGSIPLGFLAAALGMYGALNGNWPWWFPVLVFSPFIVDASVTLAIRIFRRQRLWQAHRQHYYQRVILELGWSHTQTTCSYSLLMILAATHALLMLMSQSPQALINLNMSALPPFHVGAWVLIYALLLIGLERRFSKKKNKSSNKKNEI